MELSLEQIHSLTAIAETGSITGAAKKLNKTHTAILYQIKQLESQVGFSLLERNRYRSQLTAKGEMFLQEARRFLHAEGRLLEKTLQIQTGGLGRWNVVYDAIFPVNILLDVTTELQKRTTLSVNFLSDSLNGVEKTFWREEFDYMISLVPPDGSELVTQQLGSLRSFLVIQRDHPLLQQLRTSSNAPAKWVGDAMILVRGVDSHWSLSSEVQRGGGRYFVNDFYTKKEALLRGFGVGWMPEHLIYEELADRKLVILDEFLKSEMHFPVFYSARSSLAQDELYLETQKLLRQSDWLIV